MGEDGIDRVFKQCLEKGKLRKFTAGKRLFSKELRTAEGDLIEAQESHRRGKFKWATI